METIYDQYMYSYPHKTAYEPLLHIDLSKYLDRLSGVEDTLYFHIPFCETKCGYCNLFSITGQKEEDFWVYLNAMERQCEQYALKEDVSFANLVLGGGTPLILSIQQLEKVFHLAEKYCHTSSHDAFTITETSPNQTEEEKLAFLKEKGLNRISIGIQSFHDRELEMLGRRHKVKEADRALKLIKQYGFDVMNLDLIYGIPEQTLASFSYSLEKALSYEPEEIFSYPLYIQEGTWLSKQGVVPSGKAYDMYRLMCETLAKAGYRQTSMRRFTKTQEEVYTSCGFEKTLAIGCGGRSYIEELHFCSPYAIEGKKCRQIINDYIHKENYKVIEYGYLLSKDEMKRRYVIKNLLYSKGIPLKEYQKLFGGTVLQDYQKFGNYMTCKYVKEESGFLKLTDKGMGLSDVIGPTFISDEVRKKMRGYGRA